MPAHPPASSRAPAIHAAALLTYLGLAIGLTWPLVTHMSTGVIGGFESYNFTFEDASQNIWNIWWIGRALASGQNPFWTNMLYYPEGVQLYIQTLDLTAAMPVLPINYLFGSAVAYNCAVLLSMTLTGYAGFLLARNFVPSVAEPLLAGALLSASPFHLMKLQGNHLNLVSMQWMIFYVLALVWLDRHRDRRAILFAAAMAALVVLTDWYWALGCMLFTAVWAGIGLARGPDRGGLLRAYLVLSALVLALAIPLALGIWDARASLPVSREFSGEQWKNEIQGFSSDALGLFFPALWRFLSPEQTQALLGWLNPDNGYFFPEGWYVAAGWVLLALASLGIWVAGRAHWPIAATGGMMWLLSLGPALTVAGRKLAIPLPYTIIAQLPLFAMARRPSHFAALTMIVATIFAAVGLRRLAEALPPPGRIALLLGIAVLAAVELWPESWRYYPIIADPVFVHMRESAGVVADLPYEQRWSSRSLRNQVVHEQAILGGYVARRPPYETFLAVPLLSQIGMMQPWPGDIVPLDTATLQAMQCYYRLRHVAVRLDKASDEQRRGLERVLTTLLGAPPSPNDRSDQYVAYELPLFPNDCRPFLYLGTGWHDLENDASRFWRWTSESNQIWMVNPGSATATTLLHITAQGHAATTPVEIWDGQNLLARWEVSPDLQQYDLVLNLPPGETALTLRAKTSPEPDGPRQLGIAVVELQLVEPLRH
jgi:hypothetical protein